MIHGSRLWNRDFDIRTRVIALITVLLVPLLGLAAWLSYNYADAERRVIEAKRFDAVNNVTFLFDREIVRLRSILSSLALAPDVINGHFEGIRGHASAIAAATQGPLAIFDETGRQLFTTEEPPTARPLLVTPSLVAGVSGVVRSDPAQPAVIALTIPVTREGKLVYVIQSLISPDRLAPLFVQSGLKPAWISAVVDREGRFIARSLNSERSVGAVARPELGKAARGEPDSGDFENVTIEGVASANSFRRSGVTGWTAVVAVPKSELAAPLQRTQNFVLWSGLLISLASLGAAWQIATRISEPVRKLATASTALVEGRPLPDIPHQITELTEVRAAFEHAGAKLAHLAAIIASSGDAILSVGLDGRILSWNPGAERLFGYSAAEMIGKHKSVIIPPERLEQAMAQLDRARRGERVRSESQRLRSNGTLVDVSLDLAPIGDKDGSIIGMSTIAHDITEKKLAEEHQHFLMRELTHRSKNLLAVINAMARQTARSAGSLAEFEARFSRRIQGMAASHDLLVSQNWAAASLRELVIRHIQIFVDNVDQRLDLSGPEVYVGVEAAQTLGLALHELATNSMKYGALSRPTGKVVVDWAYETMDNGNAGLRVTWTERGGPPVVKPERTGFGHIVTERMVAQSLDGVVTMDYQPGGLVWSLKFPNTHLVDRTIRQTNRPMADALS